jgi:hypothetical protein
LAAVPGYLLKVAELICDMEMLGHPAGILVLPTDQIMVVEYLHNIQTEAQQNNPTALL